MASILVIDDTEAVRLLCRAVLEQAGYTISEATNGREGIRLFNQAPTDAVVTDMHMPNGTGLEVINELRAQHSHLKILAVSGAEQEDGMLRTAKVLGVDGILLKPFGVDDLTTAVAKLFNTLVPNAPSP
jgi:two-component system chemotaxis response regulator CheY